MIKDISISNIHLLIVPIINFSGQGFVIPGNNKIGYLFYKERYYSTSTVDRAEQFGRNPDLFIIAMKKLIRDSPCLLKLLNVTDEEAEEEEFPSKLENDKMAKAYRET